MHETKRDEALEAEIAECLRSSKHRAIEASCAFGGSVIAIVPFLYGHALHRYGDPFEKTILVLSMCLLPVFLFVAGTTYNLWSHLRAIKTIHR